MGSETISIEGQLTAEDYVKSNFAVLRKNAATVIFITFLVLALLLVLPDLLSGKLMENYTLIMSLVLVLFIYLVIRPLAIRRNYKKSIKLQNIVHWTISDEKIMLKTDDIEISYKWSEFKKYYETKEYLFFELKVPKRRAQFIPKRFMAENGIEGKVREIVRKTFDDKKS